jgi:hypothetical protein
MSVKNAGREGPAGNTAPSCRSALETRRCSLRIAALREGSGFCLHGRYLRHGMQGASTLRGGFRSGSAAHLVWRIGIVIGEASTVVCHDAIEDHSESLHRQSQCNL